MSSALVPENDVNAEVVGCQLALKSKHDSPSSCQVLDVTAWNSRFSRYTYDMGRLMEKMDVVACVPPHRQ